MSDYPAGVIRSRGQEFPLTVSDEGAFRTMVGTQVVSAWARSEVQAKVDTLTRRAQVTVAVEYCSLAPAAPGHNPEVRVLRRFAVGIHGGTGALLISRDGGKPSQRSERFSRDFTDLEPLTPEQEADWVRLHTAAKAARADLDKFIRAHRIDLRKKVEAAIAAVTTPGGGEQR